MQLFNQLGRRYWKVDVVRHGDGGVWEGWYVCKQMQRDGTWGYRERVAPETLADMDTLAEHQKALRVITILDTRQTPGAASLNLFPFMRCAENS
jgi:hypothetical protein